MRWPDAIQSAAAATRPMAVRRRFHRSIPRAVRATRAPVLAGRARTASHCDTDEAAARRMYPSWALARHMTGSPPTPLLQRSNRERAFAHIVGETEANPYTAP